jgi:hypothetical protein
MFDPHVLWEIADTLPARRAQQDAQAARMRLDRR